MAENDSGPERTAGGNETVEAGETSSENKDKIIEHVLYEKESEMGLEIETVEGLSKKSSIENKIDSEIIDNIENITEQRIPSSEDVHFDFETDTQGKKSQPSDESVFGPEESVTVQHFVRDELGGSTVSYSTAEIRKGIFGDKSGDKIERASSENTVKAAETVHNIGLDHDMSSEFISQEIKSEEIIREDQSQSEKDLSQQESQSFIVLPPENFWLHVPGIGPVIPEPQILAVVEYMQYWATKQQGMIMPRNINHILCPPLDLPPPLEDEDQTAY